MEREPGWYKDAVIYELHVRAYQDSDGDGIGDFRGLQSRLPYLKDLGVTALWLLPFYPSPLRDDGYDISDYTSINPIYGTLDDFKRFLAEAHHLGLRVITELVLNHTSDQHPWFQRSRRAPKGDPMRDWYVWSDRPDRYRHARIIFKDFEHSNWAWDNVANAYYWHRFYSHQPDLNWDNPEVKAAMFGVVDFWLEMGVDGLRLDAVPYLFERENTNCENLPETHQALKELRAHVDAKFKDRMLLGEANQWPEDAASYFGQGQGDECHMAFHFPIMPRMFMSVQTEDRFPLIDIVEQTPSLPESGQWAIFLRNHDELTLEMVTDEERDYMYRMYADDPQARINLGIRRRLAPLLGNNRRKIELLNGLLFSLPGTPVLYYGDEIGMGDNIYLGDRNGVRTPMQWSADRNAGFSPANAQRLYLPVIIDPEYHYEAYNVDVQQNNPQSLLWWMKRFIALRKRSKVFGRGTLEMVPTDNRKILSFVRSYEDESVLVVANLSRFVQPVELPLSRFAGHVPVEMLGRTPFPKIPSEGVYSLTLGPHSFYWFALRPPGRAAAAAERVQGSRPLVAPASWEELLSGDARAELSDAVADWLRRTGVVVEASAWKRRASIVDTFRVGPAIVAIVSLLGSDARQRLFFVPFVHVPGAKGADLAVKHPRAVIAPVVVAGAEGLILHASVDKAFCAELFHLACSGAAAAGETGRLASNAGEACASEIEEPAPHWDLQGNVSVACGGAVLRLITAIEPGVSTEVEIPLFLRRKACFEHLPPILGSLQYNWGRETATVAVANGPARSERSAWMHASDAMRAFLERAQAAPEALVATGEPILDLAEKEIPASAYEQVGPFLHEVELLARRVAELHKALASDPTDPAFAPEPFTWLYQRSLYQSMRTHTREAAALLRRRIDELPEDSRDEARALVGLEEEALRRLRSIHLSVIDAVRIRCHGDLHLGRALYTGKDFLFTGFEGDLTRSVADRRNKRSPLWDVACLLRSFHYAANAGLIGRPASGVVRPEDRAALEGASRYWTTWVCAAFMRAYLAATAGTGLVPASRAELEILLDALVRERAVRDLARELNESPARAAIPLKGLPSLLAAVAR